MPDISDHARVLHKLYSELSSTVDAQTVADYMFQKNELTQRDLESIQSKHNEPIRAAEQLLDIIMEKSRSAYWCFLEALKQSRQEHVRKMIILESSESEFSVLFIYTFWAEVTARLSSLSVYFWCVYNVILART